MDGLEMEEDDPFYQVCALLSETSNKTRISETSTPNTAFTDERTFVDNGSDMSLIKKGRAKTASKPAPTQSWTKLDEIFLTGIVIKTYRKRHSLKPFRNVEKSEKYLAKSETLVWNRIHRRYEVAR